jgi:hypothetical protein
MSSFHANPEDAVDMFCDVRARAAIGMHWGTFLLTDEPIEEPPQRLLEAARRRGLSKGAWLQLPPAAAPAAAQLTFSCPDCLFSGASALAFQLPFACQAVFMEVGAVASDGTLNVLSVPPAVTTPPQGSLLTGVLWEISPLLDLRNDTLKPGDNARGWQMIVKDASATFSTPAAQAGGALTVQPLAASIGVSITFALQPFA